MPFPPLPPPRATLAQDKRSNGNASKEQVAKMLQSLSLIEEIPKNLDSTDGLAAAVCHFFNRDNLDSGKKFSGWKSFLTQNPHKIKKV